MKLDGKRVLITGGSSGIGLALANHLARKGARLLITGRRSKPLAAAVAGLAAGGASICSVVGDVSTPNGRIDTLRAAETLLGGLDVLINNAGGVRAGRLEAMSEGDIRTMIETDLVAPILLVRGALPLLRQSGTAMIVNVASNAALLGMPYYAAYAGAKAGLSRFGEALRRELDGEGVHVLTAYPAATDTPMMESSLAGPELGFTRESADAVAEAIVTAIEADALDVIRGGPARAAMLTLNRDDPRALDRRFASMKIALEAAVRDHKAL